MPGDGRSAAVAAGPQGFRGFSVKGSSGFRDEQVGVCRQGVGLKDAGFRALEGVRFSLDSGPNVLGQT